MEIKGMIEHMNSHHKDCVLGLFVKFGGSRNSDANLVDINIDGLTINSQTESIKVPFGKEVLPEDYKDEIINLCKSLNTDFSKIKAEIDEFLNSFNSVVISSVDKSGQAIASYSAILRSDDKIYIYISQVSEHYSSISANPDKISLLFLQDEKEAKSIILRKRLTYKANAILVKRDSDEFNSAMQNFLSDTKGHGGTKQIAQMEDFHLFRLEFKRGRFVKGFGGAYDIVDDQIMAPHVKNPHSFKKSI